MPDGSTGVTANAPREIAPTWHITELVQFGLLRREEAERNQALAHMRGDGAWIVIEQIYAGATRISSRIEQFTSAAGFYKEQARRYGRALVVLRLLKSGPCKGQWIVDDFCNVAGDRTDVNRMLGVLRKAASC